MKDFSQFFWAATRMAGSERGLFSNKNFFIRMVVPLILSCIIIAQFSPVGLTFFYNAFLFMMISAVASVVWSIKPNLVALMPITYKKRTLYYFLYIIVMCLIITLVIFAVFATMILFFYLCDMLSGGDVTVDDTDNITDLSTFSFGLIALQWLFFSVLTIGWNRLKNRKHYWLFSVGFFVVMEVVTLLLRGTLNQAIGNGFTLARVDYYSLLYLWNGNWIVYLLFALGTVSAIVWSAMLIVKQEKPKKF
jgi:hypothetical protein